MAERIEVSANGREITIDGVVYRFKRYTLHEKRKINTGAMTIKFEEVKSDTGEMIAKTVPVMDPSEKMVLTIFYALESWSLMDSEGKMLPITMDTFDARFPFDEAALSAAFKVAWNLNEVSVLEKNSLSK